MITSTAIKASLAAVLGLGLAIGAAPAQAAGDAPKIPAQKWTFGGVTGNFDRAQLQRGYQVYKEVCATCHGLKHLAFRNLAEPGGPEFAEAGVKSLAATFKIDDGPNDDGKMFKRPGKLSDAIPNPFRNEQEARSAQNGALPPDLSLITKARSVHNDVPFYIVPFIWLKDIINGYQEGGADYVHALLTGYDKPAINMVGPDGKPFKVAEGMHYNKVFPGWQIAMVAPLSDGIVKYGDGSKTSVEQYSRDVTAFLHWAGDPKLEERKRIGRMAMLYLFITSVLLYLAKKRIWSKRH